MGARLDLRNLAPATQSAGAVARGVRVIGRGHEDAERDEPVAGRVLALPGIFNTRLQLAPLARSIGRRVPWLDVKIRRWGVPFRGLHNLTAFERNLETAARIAADLAAWRSRQPRAPLYVMGFSGGGGMATLVTAALPAGLLIDRLILVAPAISPRFPILTAVVPRVREFVACYASRWDLQVGWGTEAFGTLDRARTKSAGAVGFEVVHPKLLQWHWSPPARRDGHYGNHLSYLCRRWQEQALSPAFDPAVDAASLRALWAVAMSARGEGSRGLR
jgi:pimeloyl-ACP methyl ester carboxylesterase